MVIRVGRFENKVPRKGSKFFFWAGIVVVLYGLYAIFGPQKAIILGLAIGSPGLITFLLEGHRFIKGARWERCQELERGIEEYS